MLSSLSSQGRNWPQLKTETPSCRRLSQQPQRARKEGQRRCCHPPLHHSQIFVCCQQLESKQLKKKVRPQSQQKLQLGSPQQSQPQRPWQAKPARRPQSSPLQLLLFASL